MFWVVSRVFKINKSIGKYCSAFTCCSTFQLQSALHTLTHLRCVLSWNCYAFVFLYHAIIIHINLVPRGPTEIRALLCTERIKKASSYPDEFMIYKSSNGWERKERHVEVSMPCVTQPAACRTQVFCIWGQHTILWLQCLLLMSKLARKNASHFVSSSEQARQTKLYVLPSHPCFAWVVSFWSFNPN